MKTNNLAGVIFDLDGTLYLGEKALPGAVETCAELRRRGVKLAFVSNKPLDSRSAYAQKLTRFGIQASSSEVITSASVLGSYLHQNHPSLKLYVLGEDNLLQELRQHGLHLIEDIPDQDTRQVIEPLGIEAVVASFDRTLDYRKLNIAYQALLRGARFFATNADKACPMPGGSIPDAGAIIAALEHITGRKVELIAGKPSPLILQAIAQTLALPPDRCLMVGDRMETDIRMGVDAGMRTALMLTGVTRREDLMSHNDQPDHVLERLVQLLEIVSV